MRRMVLDLTSMLLVQGFLYALTVGSKFIETGTYNNVVVVGADKMSSIIDYTDRATCIIFGDGAGAVLLGSTTSGNGVIDSILKGDGAGREFLHMKAGGSAKPANHETVDNKEHFVFQDGKPVFKAAVNGMISTVNEVLEKMASAQKRFRLVGSSSSQYAHHQFSGDTLDIPKEKIMINIHKYGNTTAGTLPLCLNDYEKTAEERRQSCINSIWRRIYLGSVYLIWDY